MNDQQELELRHLRAEVELLRLFVASLYAKRRMKNVSKSLKSIAAQLEPLRMLGPGEARSDAASVQLAYDRWVKLLREQI